MRLTRPRVETLVMWQEVPWNANSVNFSWKILGVLLKNFQKTNPHGVIVAGSLRFMRRKIKLTKTVNMTKTAPAGYSLLWIAINGAGNLFNPHNGARLTGASSGPAAGYARKYKQGDKNGTMQI